MNHHPTAKYPVVQRSHAMVLDWADELAAVLGRPADEIRSDGLGAGDFPGEGVLQVRLADSSTLRFRYALHAVRPSEHALAVFTEHCGHHVFPLHDAEVSRLTETSLYPPPDGE